MPPDSPSRHFTSVLATDVPVRTPTVYCGPCGAPLRPVDTGENAAPHRCDGDYAWLDGQADV